MAIVRNMMVFIDGENLVIRYQAMKEKGWSLNAGITHEPDIFVWKPEVIQDCGFVSVVRATYYTYVVGADDKIAELSNKIKKAQYVFKEDHSLGKLGHLMPRVFKKPEKAAKRKGVDINITVDALTHTYRNSLDIVYLVTGDGDYLPLIEEVMRNGKQVFLAALSDGLSPSLPNSVDHFFPLDNVFFSAAPS